MPHHFNKEAAAVSTAAPATPPQSFAKTLGQLWGIAFVAFIFGFGAYRLLVKGVSLFDAHPPLTALDYLIYAAAAAFAVFKAEMLFRRKFIPRALARARTALGETGWSGDYLLAPFCMLSLYRPWKRKHMILSWLILPTMILLAVAFIVWVPDGVFKGAVDLAIGAALGFAALFLVGAFVAVLMWWLTGAKPERHPLPATAD